MSRTIDERVVEMRFDNKQFEQNVQTSLASLDKLKQSLDFDGAVKGFESINSAAKNVNMSGLSEAVETVKSRFSALEVIAITALANITNSVINTGKQMLQSLTIEPITQGFEEYELKMGSIQTIMMSTGASLEEVNGYLNELNTYADRTIYSFADMTSNIGKFTNAGVKLEDAVMAIQGISNAAAVSGANTNEASRAMYNFAQALSAGYVKLIDWKSIENANMATVEFKNQLLEAAVAAGTLEKSTDGMYKVLTTNAAGQTMKETISATRNFNDSLAYQWMTTEALVSTLRDYADETTDIGKKAFAAAQEVKTFSQLIDTMKEAVGSGWAMTWEIIFGDFNEAKKLWTEASEYWGSFIDSLSDARNELLRGGLSSGWKQLLNEGISDASSFKEMVSSVAREHGIAIDDMIQKSGSFEETLKDGWLTSDILTESISKFTEKVSKMSDEEMKAAGYTKEQVEELKALNASVKDGSISMEIFSNKIASMSGRENLIQALRNAFSGLVSVVKPAKDAFREIFPQITSDQLYNMTVALKEFTSHLTISENASKNLKNTFKGLFAILDIGKQAFLAIFQAITPLFGGLDNLSGGILSVTGKMGEWMVKTDDFIKKNDVFGQAIQGVIRLVRESIDVFKEFGMVIKEKFHLPDFEEIKSSIKDFLNIVSSKIKLPSLELIHVTLERIHKRMSSINDAAGTMKNEMISAISAIGDTLSKCKVFETLGSVWNAIKSLLNGAVDALGRLIDTLVDKLSNANFEGVIDVLNALSLGGLALGVNGGINGFFDNLVESVTESVKKITSPVNQIKDILNGVKDCLSTFQKELQAKALIKIAQAIGILAASIVALSLIDSEKLSESLGAITVMFANLIGAMAIYEKLGPMAAKGANKLIVFSGAVLVLSAAVKQLADLSWGGLIKGLTGVGVLLAEIDIFMATAKFSKNVTSTANGILVLSAAIKILASAARDLAELSWEQLAKGLTGVGVLLTEIDIFLNTAKLSGKTTTTATGVTILAAAMKILASACKDFGEMAWEQIGKGLTGIGGLLAEIAAFTNLTGNAKHVLSTGMALIEISAAMKIFASAMDDFSRFSWEQIARGLTAMGGALAEVAIAVNVMPKNMVSIGSGLVVVAGALEIMADVLSKMGNFSWEQIAKGLILMGGALAELAIGLNAMNGTLAGSAAMLTAASALAVLTPVLSVLGAMSWEAIVKGLVSIAGAFAVLGTAGAVLTPLVPTIVSLSGALALVGVGVVGIGAGLLAAGTGLTALATGFTALAAAGAAGATSIVASLTVIITGVAGLIPTVIEKIGEGIIAFCNAIANGAPAIAEACKAVVLSLVDVLKTCIPNIASGALELVTGVLEALVNYTPQIVDFLFQFLINVLEGVVNNLPELIKMAVDAFMSFFAGIVDGLRGIDTEVLLKGIAGVGLLSAIMVALSGVTALVPGAMAGILGMGAVIAELAVVLAAVGALAQLPGLSWLIGEGGKLLQGIGTAIGQFVGGIVGGFMSGISSQFPQIGADLAAFMTNVKPFLEGASSIQPSMLDGVSSLAKAVLILTATDILQGLASWFTGGSSMSKFAEELVPFGKAMSQFSKELSGMDGELVANATNAGKALAEMAQTIPNSGGIISWFTGDNDMSKFAAQIVPFGKAMNEYSKAVSGIDATAIESSAIAGKALAELAQTIPNTGGIISWFTGDNDIASFGASIIPFGKAMKSYSLEVTGIDANAVINSATAGQALVELSQTLPNTGGIISWFTGDNDLASFGQAIIPFGEAMKSYSLSVSGIDANAVLNSATAGQALVELAKMVPNTGGIISWFTGDNDIASFGANLVLFGEHFSKYSGYMMNVDAGVVTATTNAATSIVELQKSLPKEGGWFSGDQSLADFGNDMSKFGAHFRTYNESISGTDVGLLSSVIAQTTKLVELAKGMAEVDSKGMSEFGAALTKLGQAGVDGFINAFNNASDRVSKAATTMIETFCNAAKNCQGNLTSTFESLTRSALTTIENKQGDFRNTGSTSITRFVEGAKSQDGTARSTFTTIVTGCLTMITDKYGEFQNVGTALMEKLLAGIKSQDATTKSNFEKIIEDCLTSIKNKYGEFQNTGQELVKRLANAVQSNGSTIQNEFSKAVNNAVKSVRNLYNEFYNAGYYLVSGFANGISANSYMAAARARAMAAAAARAARAELDEHSPSKVGYEIGDFFGVAFVNAIADYAEKAYKAGAEIAKSAKAGLKEAVTKISEFINEQLNKEPIKPVLDLTALTDSEEVVKKVANATQSVSDSVRKAYEAGVDIVKTAKTDLKEAIEKFKEFIQSYVDVDVTSVMNKISEVTETVLQVDDAKPMDRVVDAANSVSDYMKKTYETGEKIVKSMTSGLKEAIEKVKEFLKSKWNEIQIKTDLDTTPITGSDGVIDRVVESAQSVSDSVKNAYEAGVDIVKTAKTDLKEAIEKFKEFIQSYSDTDVTSLVEPISNYVEKAYAEGSEFVESAKNSLKEAIEKFKEFMKSCSDMDLTSIMDSVSKCVEKAYETGVEIAKSAKNELEEAITKLQKFVNSDLNTKPTITPVLDLSNLTEKAKTIGSFINPEHSFNLATSNNAYTNTETWGKYEIVQNNEDIVKAISDLKDDMASMTSVISNLKVVMDTGALVGVLTDPLDSSLGKRATYTGRGI